MDNVVRIEIKKHADGVGVLISFDMDCSKFDSNYERNKFFRGLYGWDQTIRKNNSVYYYRREGVLGRMPHIKVDNSVFIVTLQKMQSILDYFGEWENKVTWKTFRVLLDDAEQELLEMEGQGKEDLNED